MKYAVYTVVIEDTNEAFEWLSDSSGATDVDRIGDDLEYEEAMSIVEQARELDR